MLELGHAVASSSARHKRVQPAAAPSPTAAPSIAGVAVVGETLIADDGVWTGDPAPALSRIWRRDGAPVAGRTGERYVVTGEDAGAAIDVLVTALGSAGDAVAASPPAVIAPLGDLRIRSVPAMTTTAGAWWGLDLSAHAISESPTTYGAASGSSLPAGLALDGQTGFLHGVPTTPGVHTAKILVATAGGGAAMLTVRLEVVQAFGVSDGSAYFYRDAGANRDTPNDLVADSPRLTFACLLSDTSEIASTTVLFETSGRNIIRFLSDGMLNIQLASTTSGGLGSWLNWTSDGDIRRPGPSRLVVTVDATRTPPAFGVTLNGAAIAGAFATRPMTPATLDLTREHNGLLANDEGTAALPAGAGVGWVHIDATAVHADGDFDGADPAAVGSPYLFYRAGAESGFDFELRGGALVGPDPTPLAFPDAVGFGRFATGGRGRPVYRVTSLSADAAVSGSLPWALAQIDAAKDDPAEANRGGTILIEAEGELALSDQLEVTPSDITLDARRAPGMGFWITGARVRLTGSNVIAIGLRLYPGSSPDGQQGRARDALTIGNDGVAQSDIYLRNCDMMFGIDEVVSTFGPGDKTGITLHDCLIAEGCHASIHDDEVQGVDDHAKMLLLAARTQATVYGCAIASGDDRTPRVVGPDTTAEIVSNVIANFNSQAPHCESNAFADFHNNFFMQGPRPAASGANSPKRVYTSTPATEVIHVTGEFSGSWTAAGGFDATTMRDEWRYNGGGTNYLLSTQLDNATLFTKSGVLSGAMSYSEAFLSLASRVGARNAAGERHPFAARVVGYLTEDTPFTGYDGEGFTDDMIPDELRAVGGDIAGGSGQVTVTLPDAATKLPPPAGRTWSSVEVAVLDAYDGAWTVGQAAPARTADTWADDASTATGSLSGGAVTLTGLSAGWYVARVTWTDSAGVELRAYTGRPVSVD